MTQIPPVLQPVLAEQQGLLTRQQLYEAGLNAGQIRWALGRTWQVVHRDVFCVTTGRLDPGQRLIAAQLWAGPEAQLASTTAARYFGLTAVPDDAVAGSWSRGSTTRATGPGCLSGVRVALTAGPGTAAP